MPEINGENKFVEHLEGYFHAPVAGDYRFSVVSDDSTIMKMSSFKNNANKENMVEVLRK